ncbi:MAG: hypothetical protein JWO30_966 [Fibrobacteres bacterium]|nr:hypothetical protein [Fibrobacterota bacterium]
MESMRNWLRNSLLSMERNVWILSTVLGVLSFLVSVMLQPPPFLIVLFMSVPFFAAAIEAKWKVCIQWIVITFPFQYYFDIGGLSLTHTEVYLFVFGGAYALSRIVPSIAFSFPSSLAVPLLYGLAPLLAAMLGHFGAVKEAVRVLIAVFFCPPLSTNGFPVRSCAV